MMSNIKINSNTGTLNNGNTLIISPTTITKTSIGSGGGVTGDFSATFSVLSITITKHPNAMDTITRRPQSLR